MTEDNTITSNEAGVRNSLNSCWLDSGNSLLSTTQNMTEDKTTITDNEVIALFMGHAVGKIGKYHTAPYNTSWEWLMPVWYKFKEIVIENDPDQYRRLLYRRCAIAMAIIHDGVEHACKLLAEGIRWYNSTTQNNTPHDTESY